MARVQPQQDEIRRVNDFDHREPDRSGHVSGRRGYLKAALPIALAGLLLGVASYLFFDPAVLDSAPDLHLSQLVQSLLASLAVAILVVWFLGARREPTFPQTSDALSLPLRGDRVRRHAQWFVQMRWVAVAVSLALIFIAVLLSEILPHAALPNLLAWWVALIGANIWFGRRLRWAQDLEKEIVLQASVDLVVLTGWLNASGGIENPFYHVYILHVIIAGILLPKRKALFVTTVACTLTCFLAAAEYFRLVPHVTISVFPHSYAEGEHAHAEGGMLHASLDPVFVLRRMIPFLATLNLVAYLTTIIADRLRRSEDELEEAARTEALERRRLEGVIHSAGLGVVLIDPDLTLRWYSGRAAEWLDLDPSSIGKVCDSSDEGAGCSCLVAETARSGSPMETERVVELSPGKVRYLRHATWPVLDSDGRVQQVVKLVQDMTAQKALEAKAVHAGKLSALGKMAAAVAHEINNPLASLSSRLSRMERSDDPEFLRESVGVLRGQLSRIGRIVHTVSQFSKAPAQARTTWDVTAAVDEALSVISLDPRAAKTHFEWRPSSSCLLVNAVRDQILQAYLNLLINAAEATRKGGQVTVRAFASNREVAVEVEDFGEGIESSMEDRLFEAFATTKPLGIGIGLAISQSLVHAHGGRIEVQSEPGKGSRFTVLLPAADATTKDSDSREAAGR